MSNFRKYEFKPEVGKLSFVDVAKHSGLSVTAKKFQNQATEALKKAGYQPSVITGILSGHKKMDHDELAQVFAKLNKERIVSRGSSVVRDFVKKEEGRQTRMYSLRIRERSKEIASEKKDEPPKNSNKTDSEGPKLQPGRLSAGIFTGESEPKTEADMSHFKRKKPNIKPVSGLAVTIDPEIANLRQKGEAGDLPID